MKDASAIMVLVLGVCFLLVYTYHIKKQLADPAISTWIIFLSGVMLSFITYVISEDWDIKSGILNTIDLFNVSCVIIAILFFRGIKLAFKPFEKWYLIGVVVVIIIGFVTGSAWKSNLLVQVLMTVAYIPTIHHIVASKKNTESFLAWGLALSANTFGLYPAYYDGNFLAMVYTTRANIMVIIVLCLMIRYQFFYNRS